MRTNVSAGNRRDFSSTRRLAVYAICLLLALFVSACGSDTETPRSPASTAAPRVIDTEAPGGAISITVPGTLAADFAELERSQEGELGLAIMPVGGQKFVGLGAWTTGPAWSTMKVPLAIAAERKNPGGPSYATSAAITASDNNSADTLWSALGSAKEAAQAVQEVLRDGGDTTTTVQDQRVRSDYSAFGQSEWALADQVRFAAQLPCLTRAGEIVELMESVDANQQWGIGSVFDGAKLKGGWGPDTDGNYLVRQFGLIPSGSGTLAVALAAQPDSGTFADGTNLLDQVAGLISRHLDDFTPGSCAA